MSEDNVEFKDVTTKGYRERCNDYKKHTEELKERNSKIEDVLIRKVVDRIITYREAIVPVAKVQLENCCGDKYAYSIQDEGIEIDEYDATGQWINLPHGKAFCYYDESIFQRMMLVIDNTVKFAIEYPEIYDETKSS